MSYPPQVPPQYPAGGYAPGAPKPPSKTLSLLSLIGGIVGLVLVCCFGSGVLFSIAAIVLGHLGRSREPEGRGMAMGGLIMGYIGAGLAILSWIFWLVLAPLLGIAAFIPFLAYTG